MKGKDFAIIGLGAAAAYFFLKSSKTPTTDANPPQPTSIPISTPLNPFDMTSWAAMLTTKPIVEKVVDETQNMQNLVTKTTTDVVNRSLINAGINPVTGGKEFTQEQRQVALEWGVSGDTLNQALNRQATAQVMQPQASSLSVAQRQQLGSFIQAASAATATASRAIPVLAPVASAQAQVAYNYGQFFNRGIK